MAGPSVRMSEPNFVETVNRGHAAFLKKLRLPAASDSAFPYLLSSAALNLCLNFKDVKLRGKLKYVDELFIEVKKGFEQKDLLRDLSEEERDRWTYSKELFTKIFRDKLDERKTVDMSIASASKESKEGVVQESITVKETKGGKEEPKCSICRQSLKRPKILPCSHVFCMHCLEETGRTANKNPGDMMPCEVCGQEFTIPTEGCDGLGNFKAVEKEIEPIQVLDSSSAYRIILCEACAEDSDLDDVAKIRPAAIYCVDCKKKLCSECQRYHKRLLKTHKVQALKDPQNVPAASVQLTIKSKTGNLGNVQNVGLLMEDTDKDINKIPKHCTPKHYISKGSSGEIYGPFIFRDSRCVCERIMLTLEKVSSATEFEVCCQGRRWMELDHISVLKFYNVLFQPPVLYVVMEYAKGGTVRKALNSCTADLEISVVKDWAMQIAVGMNYLHREEIVHGHIKAAQILIMERFDPTNLSPKTLKIASYRLTMDHAQSAAVSIQEMFGWMSPEAIKGEPLCKASDVYSYGVTVWEILTKAIPYEGVKQSVLIKDLSKGRTLSVPSQCPNALCDILNECWEQDKYKRPTFPHILSRLRAVADC